MSKHNKKKNTGRTVLLVLLALVLIIAFGSFGAYKYIKGYNKPADSTSSKTVDFVIPKGASTSTIGKLLEEAGLIENQNIFKFKTRFNNLDGKYQAGEYELSASMPMEEIMTRIQDGRRETTRFTIKEGLSLHQIADSLAEQGVATKEDFYKSLEEDEFDYWFVPLLKESYADPSGEVSSKANRFEGFLFPDTYEIYVGASARNIISKMLGRFNEVFTEDLKAKLNEKNLSIQEALTVASLIEREIVEDKERALCASVIYNRLNTSATGKKLQFCSTVLYSLGNPEGKNRVLLKDLEIDCPYNTYANPGLPPGPICCPGAACINAALNPADTDYLYFVVKSKGSTAHNFSSNYSDHAAYREDYLQTVAK